MTLASQRNDPREFIKKNTAKKCTGCVVYLF